jgi:DNA-binding ferritin-like protein (Dps family)
MNFWERVTGSDLTREYRAFEARAERLPADFRAAWGGLKTGLMPYGDLTGRNLMPILDNALGLLEESAADGQDLADVLGEDIPGVCAALAGGEGSRTYRDRWRDQLNRTIARKLERLGG